MDKSWKILLVDDDEDDFILTRELLAGTKENNFQLSWSSTYWEALQAFTNASWDAVLVDHDLGKLNGIDLIREINRIDASTPVLMVTGRGNFEKDVEAMEAGAVDYLSKFDLTSSLLERSIRYAIDRKRTEEELENRVRERTRALENANRKLRVEIEERNRAEMKAARQAFLLENIRDAIIAVDDQARITSWNRGAEEIYGWTAQEVLGKRTFDLLQTKYLGLDRDQANQIAIANGYFEGETQQVKKDGATCYTFLRFSPLLDKDGKIFGYVSVNRDISAAKQAEQQIQQEHCRNRARAELSQALTQAEPDIQKVLDLIVERIAKLIGDACTLGLLSKDAELLQAAAFYHQNPQALELLREMTRVPYKAGEGLHGKVMETCEPVLLEDIPQDQFRNIAHPELLPYLDQFGIHTILIVPLRAQERSIGTLAVSRDRPGVSYSSEDLVFLQELADHAALAITNATLFRKLQSDLAQCKSSAGQVSA